MRNLFINTASVLRQLDRLKSGFAKNEIVRPTQESKFIFLCGANNGVNNLSERRKAIIEFFKRNLPHTQVLIAEDVFQTLADEKHVGNYLDTEDSISKFADFVLLILESPSVFAELGAFSHKELRDKLIIINDLKYRDSKSFINLGPLQAIKDSAGEDRIIYYKMNSDGVRVLDAVGETFQFLYELLKGPSRSRSRPLSLDDCDPSQSMSKDSILFIHDLVFITGFLKHQELVYVTKYIFGNDKNYLLKEHLALLKSFGAVKRERDDEIWRSIRTEPFLKYQFDVNRVISAFRNLVLRHAPERIFNN